MADQRRCSSSGIDPLTCHKPGLVDHCKRVAYYARFMSNCFDLSPAAQQALDDAALCHHSLLRRFGPDALDRIINDLPVSLPLQESHAGEAVSEFATTSGPESSAYNSFSHDLGIGSPEVLEACNCLDEAVEFAPYDGISVSQALECFGLVGEPAMYRLLGLVLHHSPMRFDGRAGLRNIDRLPVLPRQVKRLMALSVETATANDLDSIASSDQVLAASVISRVNSALYARQSKTKRIRDAIVFLGIPTSYGALVTASFQSLFASSSLMRLWNHATEAAKIAQRLAVTAGGLDPAEAYLAGLVHDIGRLIIERFPQAPRRLEFELLENGFPSVYAEAIAYRMDHAELGAGLLRDWDFPDSMVKAVLFHHRPEATDSRLSSLLYLTEVLCESDAEHAFEDLPSVMRLAQAERRVGLTMEQIHQMANQQHCLTMVG